MGAKKEDEAREEVEAEPEREWTGARVGGFRGRACEREVETVEEGESEGMGAGTGMLIGGGGRDDRIEG